MRATNARSLGGRPGRHHFLYRFYDAHGVLLYVGATADLPSRLAGHRLRQRWAEVSEVKAMRQPTREALIEAEQMAIATERPAWNVALGGFPRLER